VEVVQAENTGRQAAPGNGPRRRFKWRFGALVRFNSRRGKALQLAGLFAGAACYHGSGPGLL